MASPSPKPSNPTTPLGTPPLMSRPPSNNTFARDAQTVSADSMEPPSPAGPTTTDPLAPSQPSASSLGEDLSSGPTPRGETHAGSGVGGKVLAPVETVANGVKPYVPDPGSDPETEGAVEVGRSGEYRCY